MGRTNVAAIFMLCAAEAKQTTQIHSSFTLFTRLWSAVHCRDISTGLHV